LPLDKAVVIKNSFDHVIANRKWIISENNNIFDREYVARNLEEVSLYMISAVLFFAQRKDEALEIIKNVLDKYQVKTTLTYDDNIAIINIKILRFEIFRRENIKLKFGPLVKAGAKEKNIKIAEELITNEKNNGEPELSLLLEAQVEFARRDIHKAILRAKEACVLSKDISPACFTLAFLYFYKEDLITGWHWLKKAVTKSPKYEMMVQMPGILGWYEDALIENNEKYCLHFPLGVIYYKYMKEFKNSKESLELFLEKYQDASDRDMRPLIIEAEKILKKIRKLNG
jgi:tetratricopeptide (TPR) repeat protein